MTSGRGRVLCLITLLSAFLAAAATTPVFAGAASGSPTAGSRVFASPTGGASTGIHKIKHVVIIMQENRIFDNYFGTYPGADGIPGLAGNPGTVPCVPDPVHHNCQQPYHDASLTNAGGPHYQSSAIADIHGGAMDGFITSVEKTKDLDTDKVACLVKFKAPTCVDVMGY